MHVRHVLARVGPRVEDNPVTTARDSLRLGHLVHLADEFGEQAAVSAAASAARSG